MSINCPNCGHEITDAEIDVKARRLAIRACNWCEGDGWRIDPENRHRGPLMPGVRCDHTRWTAEQIAQATR